MSTAELLDGYISGAVSGGLSGGVLGKVSRGVCRYSSRVFHSLALEMIPSKTSGATEFRNL